MLKCRVTPFAGVWVEIILSPLIEAELSVTPFAGVWVEIRRAARRASGRGSVTPFAGVWVEIPIADNLTEYLGHTLRGCVG